MIKNIIFDFDGVLVDSEIIAGKAISHHLATLNIEFTEEEYSSIYAGNKTLNVIEDLSIKFNIKNKEVFFQEVMSVANHIYNNELTPTNGIEELLNTIQHKKFIGSNTEKVVRSSKCPVVTIKGKQYKEGCNNIILPLDLEKETREKVTYAIEYARYWDATIRIVSVVLRDNNKVRNHLQRNLKQVHKFITNAGVNCSSELLEGEKKRSLSDVVLEYEKNYESDIIMIMTKKEESLSDSLSVTARSIIFNSEIPVMCIHPKKRKHLGSTIGF